jgi:hypothetical protein
MGETNEQNEKTGQQGTNEPWKRPGQSSQDSALKPPQPRPRRDEDNETS